MKGVDLQLMTSHLESTAEHTEERVRQLKISLKHMKEAPTGRTVMFGGDLNMRDKEVMFKYMMLLYVVIQHFPHFV